MDHKRLRDMGKGCDLTETNDNICRIMQRSYYGILGIEFMEQSIYDKDFKPVSLLVIIPDINRPPRSVRILGFQNR